MKQADSRFPYVQASLSSLYTSSLPYSISSYIPNSFVNPISNLNFPPGSAFRTFRTFETFQTFQTFENRSKRRNRSVLDNSHWSIAQAQDSARFSRLCLCAGTLSRFIQINLLTRSHSASLTSNRVFHRTRGRFCSLLFSPHPPTRQTHLA